MIDDWDVAELRKQCRMEKVKGYSKMTKAQLYAYCVERLPLEQAMKIKRSLRAPSRGRRKAPSTSRTSQRRSTSRTRSGSRSRKRSTSRSRGKKKPSSKVMFDFAP